MIADVTKATAFFGYLFSSLFFMNFFMVLSVASLNSCIPYKKFGHHYSFYWFLRENLNYIIGLIYFNILIMTGSNFHAGLMRFGDIFKMEQLSCFGVSDHSGIHCILCDLAYG